MIRWRHAWLLFPCLMLAGFMFAFTHKTEAFRVTDPSGTFTAICCFKTYLTWLPMPPGSSSDKPCYVRIIDSAGKNLGEMPVVMLQLANIEWTPHGAEIASSGAWDFEKQTCYYWSEDGDPFYVRGHGP